MTKSTSSKKKSADSANNETFDAYQLAVKEHRNTHDKPLRFDDKPYLVDIYKDDAPSIVVMKSVQCGVSECNIVKTFAYALHGLSIFYVLPTDGERDTFVQNRIDDALRRSDFYESQIGRVNNRVLKKFGPGTLKFVGSQARANFKEYPADVVFIDELDECLPDYLDLASDRLAASECGKIVRVGNPTTGGRGIAAWHDMSDGKEWHVTCEHCNASQPLNWLANVVREIAENEYQLLAPEALETPDGEPSALCVKCRRPINRLGRGEWIAQRPGSGISGYHISKLFTPQTTLRELWEKFYDARGNSTLMQNFFNSEMGLPYAEQGTKLTQWNLDQCSRDYVMPSNAASSSMGIDVGARLHVVIADRPATGCRRLVHAARLNSFEELDNLIRRYNVQVAVIDALPETHKAREFRDRHAGVVFLCQYANSVQKRERVTDPSGGFVTVDRTESLDGMTANVKNQTMWLPRDTMSIDDGVFCKQMCAPTRILDGKTGRFVWCAGGEDHYFHAMNYEEVAAKIREIGAVTIVSGGPRIFRPGPASRFPGVSRRRSVFSWF